MPRTHVVALLPAWWGTYGQKGARGARRLPPGCANVPELACETGFSLIGVLDRRAGTCPGGIQVCRAPWRAAAGDYCTGSSVILIPAEIASIHRRRKNWPGATSAARRRVGGRRWRLRRWTPPLHHCTK